MAKVTVKPGVTPKLVEMVGKLAFMVKDITNPAEVVITAGTNGTHMAGSKHYSGEAFDVRTHNFANDTDRHAFYILLCQQFGPDYDVIFEGKGTPNEHIHVEYDPKPKKAV